MYDFIPIDYLNYINNGGASKRNELILLIHLFSKAYTIQFRNFKDINTENIKLIKVIGRIINNPECYSTHLRELEDLKLIKIHYHLVNGKIRKFSSITLDGASLTYENFEYYYLYHKKTRSNEKFLKIAQLKVNNLKERFDCALKDKDQKLQEFSLKWEKITDSIKKAKYDLLSIQKIIKEYSGDFNDTSYEPIHKILSDLTRGEYMSLFPPEIAILREIELYISGFCGQNLHLKVFFPKSSLRDDQNDNKLWFKTTYNQITGVLFLKCDFVNNAIWADIFRKLSKLKHLDRVIILDAEMNKLPNLIGELRNIKRLVVNNSHLKELPDSIGNLVKLEYIDFSHNSLELLPESIGNMVSLEEVYLWDNNLRKLPQNIFTLHKLRKIYLERNSFADQKSLLTNFNSRGIKAIF